MALRQKTVYRHIRLIPRQPPPKEIQRFCFTERFMAARHGEGCCGQRYLPCVFPVRKGPSSYGVAVGKGNRVSGDTAWGTGLKSGYFLKESLRGVP